MKIALPPVKALISWKKVPQNAFVCYQHPLDQQKSRHVNNVKSILRKNASGKGMLIMLIMLVIFGDNASGNEMLIILINLGCSFWNAQWDLALLTLPLWKPKMLLAWEMIIMLIMLNPYFKNASGMLIMLIILIHVGTLSGVPKGFKLSTLLTFSRPESILPTWDDKLMLSIMLDPYFRKMFLAEEMLIILDPIWDFNIINIIHISPARSIFLLTTGELLIMSNKESG